MKTPQHQSNHKPIDSMKSMEHQLRNRYNYLLANNFGDSLFPALFQHCFDYARYVATTIFPKNCDEQKRILLFSILKKSYWFHVLNAKIEDFKQTKPVPFICKRSLCSSRKLNKLLKQEINEQQMTRILCKKNIIPPQYEKFPKTLEMAIVAIEELYAEERNQFRSCSQISESVNGIYINDENSEENRTNWRDFSKIDNPTWLPTFISNGSSNDRCHNITNQYGELIDDSQSQQCTTKKTGNIEEIEMNQPLFPNEIDSSSFEWDDSSIFGFNPNIDSNVCFNMDLNFFTYCDDNVYSFEN